MFGSTQSLTWYCTIACKFLAQYFEQECLVQAVLSELMFVVQLLNNSMHLACLLFSLVNCLLIDMCLNVW